MVTFTFPAGPAPAENSYRKELARLTQSKPLSKALVHECVKSLLPQKAVYVVAVRYWSSLNQKDRSYLAKALGPDEDFSYIDEHLNLATEHAQSGRIDFDFEELVSAGVLKPLSAHTDSNGSVNSNGSANSDDSASGDAADKEAPRETYPGLYYHPFQFPPRSSPFFTDLAPPPFSWGAAPSPPSSISDLPEASPDKVFPDVNFFGQEKKGVAWTSNCSVSAENPGKTGTVASGRSFISTGFQPSGTSPPNQPPSMPSSESHVESEKTAEDWMCGSQIFKFGVSYP